MFEGICPYAKFWFHPKRGYYSRLGRNLLICQFWAPSLRRMLFTRRKESFHAPNPASFLRKMLFTNNKESFHTPSVGFIPQLHVVHEEEAVLSSTKSGLHPLDGCQSLLRRNLVVTDCRHLKGWYRLDCFFLSFFTISSACKPATIGLLSQQRA